MANGPTREELAPIVETARAIAREAGALLVKGFRNGGAVREKGRSDLVTEHDEACEKLLRARLAAAFPDHGVVGEEGEAERLDRDLVWYLDPIDGTSNFAHGHPFFCLAMGLAHRTESGERPIAGIVLAPAIGLEWAGGVGLGALRNGTPARVSKTPKLKDALCGTGFPANRAESADNNYPSFLRIDAASHGVRRCGAAAMELCLVADGAYDGFWDLGLKAWDVCAGTALIEAAGGRVTNFSGGPAGIHEGRVVATNGLLHDEILAGLSGRRGGAEGGFVELPLPPLTLPGANGLRTGSGVG